MFWMSFSDFSVCFLQDLKEKKLVEEKENGKDAATNGKVTASTQPRHRSTVPPEKHFLWTLNKMLNFYSLRFRDWTSSLFQENEENGEPDVDDEEDEEVDEEDEEDDGEGS